MNQLIDEAIRGSELTLTVNRVQLHKSIEQLLRLASHNTRRFMLERRWRRHQRRKQRLQEDRI